MSFNNVDEILQEIKNIFPNEEATDYVFYNKDLSSKNYMIILQNPGGIKEDSDEYNEIKKVEKNCTTDLIGVYNRYFQKWVNEKNIVFWEKFIESLNKLNEKFSDFGGINKEEILEKIYVTDFIKSRNLKYKKTIENSLKLIKKEIEQINPKVIFIFGGLAWNNFREEFKENLELISAKNNDANGITTVHGHLYKLNKNGQCRDIIPLAHFSGQNNCLRNSYFDYLDEGLSCIKKCN